MAFDTKCMRVALCLGNCVALLFGQAKAIILGVLLILLVKSHHQPQPQPATDLELGVLPSAAPASCCIHSCPKAPHPDGKESFYDFHCPSHGFLGSLQNLSDYVVIESEAWSNSGPGGPGRSELSPWVTSGFEPSLKRVLYFNWIMFLLSRSMFQ